MEREALKLALEKIERFITKQGYFDDFADEITAIKEALAQPEQEPVAFAGIEMWVGNTKIKLCLTQMELHNAKEPWMLIEHMAEMCISKLKEKNNG